MKKDDIFNYKVSSKFLLGIKKRSNKFIADNIGRNNCC